jgi:hypothetical protein
MATCNKGFDSRTGKVICEQSLSHLSTPPPLGAAVTGGVYEAGSAVNMLWTSTTEDPLGLGLNNFVLREKVGLVT